MDKVDVMVIQAVGLLDDLDKELNNYAMRLREWYGWHFPEIGKILPDNLAYAKVVFKMGMRTNAKNTEFGVDLITPEDEERVKEAAEISMGSEISQEDEANIKELCTQIIYLSEYRQSLTEYLRNRMLAIAPNLTVMVGELVAARLIAHAGSLISLAKLPGSTIQIFGAEKALFRALKTKHETPKYGLIYHASMVGSANPKIKGKISRSLASKCALCIRVDALGEDSSGKIGEKSKKMIEARIAALESGTASGGVKKGKKIEKYNDEEGKKLGRYNEKSEVILGKKRAREIEADNSDEESVGVKKRKISEKSGEKGEKGDKKSVEKEKRKKSGNSERIERKKKKVEKSESESESEKEVKEKKKKKVEEKSSNDNDSD